MIQPYICTFIKTQRYGKKQRFKIVISRKSNGEIHEFVLASDFTYEMALDFAWNHFPFSDCDVLAVCPVDPSVPRLAAYIVTFKYRDWETDRKSTRLNSSHSAKSRMPSSA